MTASFTSAAVLNLLLLTISPTIGIVTVVDEDFPTYYTNYEKTITILNALVAQYGGHLRVRKEDGIRYLDYLADYPDTCSQTIQFGSNLIEHTKGWDMTEFATVIVPLGNRLDKSEIEALDAYLTVESVNEGSLYVQSSEAVKTYGWIEKTVTWDSVSDPEALLEKAKAYLADLQFDNMELEVSALDLHYLNANVEAVKLLDEIRVISRPHGLDRVFPVTKLEIPLDSPENTKFTLGDTVRTSLTSVNNQISAAILEKIEGLPKAHNILKEAKENATQIMTAATTGYITITRDEYGSDTLYISNIRDYTKADKLWKWNMNGLGYGSDLRIKNSIDYDLASYEAFFLALKPSTFKYNKGTSGRKHFGFIAQDVEQAMLDTGLTSDQLAALVKDPVKEILSDGITDYRYSIRYGELIALNTHMIQKLYQMVEELLQQKEG